MEQEQREVFELLPSSRLRRAFKKTKKLWINHARRIGKTGFILTLKTTLSFIIASLFSIIPSLSIERGTTSVFIAVVEFSILLLLLSKWELDNHFVWSKIQFNRRISSESVACVICDSCIFYTSCCGSVCEFRYVSTLRSFCTDCTTELARDYAEIILMLSLFILVFIFSYIRIKYKQLFLSMIVANLVTMLLIIRMYR